MSDQNNLKISEDVIAVVAGLAANEVKGVAGLCSSGIIDDMKGIMGNKNFPNKGVKVVISENNVTIDLHIVVEYGCSIPEVASEVQIKVKNGVETMTGMNAIVINVNVDEISFKNDSETN